MRFAFLGAMAGGLHPGGLHPGGLHPDGLPGGLRHGGRLPDEAEAAEANELVASAFRDPSVAYHVSSFTLLSNWQYHSGRNLR